MRIGEPYQLPKFNIGDKVRLKTGGAEMTVHGYRKYWDGLKRKEDIQNIICIWHDKNHQEQSSTYHQDQLEAIQ